MMMCWGERDDRPRFAQLHALLTDLYARDSGFDDLDASSSTRSSSQVEQIYLVPDVPADSPLVSRASGYLQMELKQAKEALTHQLSSPLGRSSASTQHVITAAEEQSPPHYTEAQVDAAVFKEAAV